MKDPFRLDGKTAVVTGGSRGIGGAIVELFAARGAKVVFCHYGDVKGSAALLEKTHLLGLPVDGIECDVADENSVKRLTNFASERLGHVDIVVNSAGIGGDCMFVDLDVASFDRMLAVHLRGTFLVTHSFFGGMLERRWGRVINVASQLAYKGAPGLAHYCAAKAGVVGFTRALSYEGAPHGVLVNAIAPGPIETELLMSLSDEWRAMKMAQLPIRRFGLVDEIAPTALLLASDAGSNYVGQTLSPNGGDVMI
ncbi:SDR family NAD(P)-dependent oxidoreductase [Aminobacter aganoensis]|uniref:3-oxoacyl-[acyl-carrier protein] reductase n=1 Tax=Aminobacter aganoensis TaxID=83264 RepID=A0A7X0FDG3_9HYPH|nr:MULTISPECIES: 3-oxoacyl-ACP reductase family protein [Aminobacter]KQU74509.1 short-chain dehydrogenase [Aminobacter sp. DSM 101952]MBB6357686.1 3-oxoacyl-[acyl-carrier protein] reductase [Aminobacter aganoensis]